MQPEIIKSAAPDLNLSATLDARPQPSWETPKNEIRLVLKDEESGGIVAVMFYPAAKIEDARLLGRRFCALEPGPAGDRVALPVW
jgi:hypothetical protein